MRNGLARRAHELRIGTPKSAAPPPAGTLPNTPAKPTFLARSRGDVGGRQGTVVAAVGALAIGCGTASGWPVACLLRGPRSVGTRRAAPAVLAGGCPLGGGVVACLPPAPGRGVNPQATRGKPTPTRPTQAT